MKTLIRSLSSGLGVIALVTCAHPADTTLAARANDNRTSAGHLDGDGVLTLPLVVMPARWFPATDTGSSIAVAALAVEGQAPQIPGPFVRVPVGTRIRLSLRNAFSDTLVLCTPYSNTCVRGDTLPILPGASRTIEFVAGRPGLSAYRVDRLRGGKTLSEHVGRTQLVGAIMADSVGTPPNRDRVLVITSWEKDSTDTSPFVQGINGKMWPHTERFDMAVGDSVHWRLLNATETEHPMHLHGFYFRVDGRGDLERDSTYAGDARQMVVTESVHHFATSTISWSPARPGNWIFHCHKGFHMSGEQLYHLAGVKPPDSLMSHGSADHPYTTMAGLILGITVRGDSVTHAFTPARRIRLLTREQPGFYSDKRPAYVFALDGADKPASPIPGPMLTLTRGEPVEITVINQLRAPTTVHWHGIELESFYDGVGGWSGNTGALAPMIAPRDSFIARFTPPRAGTFMYHAHADEANQLASGLYGTIVVLEPGQRWNAETDHVMLFSQRGRGDSAIDVVNGGTPADTVTLRAGVAHRLRFVNITIQEEVDAKLHASKDSTVLSWRIVAKDGMSLPKTRIAASNAVLHISPGETLDAEVTLPRGDYTFDVKSFNNFPIAIRVR